MYIERERHQKTENLLLFGTFRFYDKFFFSCNRFFLKLEHLYSSSNQYVQFSLGIVSKKKPVER